MAAATSVVEALRMTILAPPVWKIPLRRAQVGDGGMPMSGLALGQVFDVDEDVDDDAAETMSPTASAQAASASSPYAFFAAAAVAKRTSQLQSDTSAIAGSTSSSSQPLITRRWAASSPSGETVKVATSGSSSSYAKVVSNTRGRIVSGASTMSTHSSNYSAAERSLLSSIIVIGGDDAMALSACHGTLEARESWRRLVASCSPEEPFEDEAFPAEPRSISGKNDADYGRGANGNDGGEDRSSAPPRCRCGSAAKLSVVRKEGPTKGRSYWHCEIRRCGLFAWADSGADSGTGDAKMGRRQARVWWQRFPEFVVVSDYGFRAEDLRQGGIGDCWFMSALAVVAERPDLILRLFMGETARNSAGCYQMQLFLDGEWRAVIVDDRLPCTDQQRRPDGSGIAYSRADGQQLWTALLEKAYAKAHGSYQAISGGEVAEALLDLTGCPTETIDFDEAGFDPEELWGRLLTFKALTFPMGCATVGNPELREVGLCGNHAYSVLDVRELCDTRFVGRERGYGGSFEDGVVRLVRIRNPHGVGEWTGEWSDRSSEWSEQLAADLGRTGVDDGTFWMDYTHFLMAFQIVDVAMAHRGWHAQSLENAFCLKSSASRLCKYLYEIRCPEGAPNTTLYAMALQPTKRGAWCREDRKKSYKPGDVSMLIIRLGKDRSAEFIVGGNFFCSDVMARRSVMASLSPNETYLIACFCFGTGPVAHGGELRGAAPFRVRLFASSPLEVRLVQSEHSPQLVSSAITSLHLACLTLRPAPGRRFWRLLRTLAPEVFLFQVSGEGAVLLLIANGQSSSVCVTLQAEVKVMTARSSEGLLTSQVQVPDGAASTRQLICFACGQAGHFATDCPNRRQKGIRSQFRYPAKWRRLSTLCHVPAKAQRLALALIGNGAQAELGSVEAELSSTEVHYRKSMCTLLESPLTRDAFEALPLLPELLQQAVDENKFARRSTEAALSVLANASLALLRDQEERQLQAALAASIGHIGESSAVASMNIEGHEDAELLLALATSASLVPAVAEEDELDHALVMSRRMQADEEDADLRAAMLMSVAPSNCTEFECPTFASEAVVLLDSDSDTDMAANAETQAADPDDLVLLCKDPKRLRLGGADQVETCDKTRLEPLASMGEAEVGAS